MKVYLFNLRKGRAFAGRFFVLLLAVAFTIGVLFIVDGYVVRYVEAAAAGDEKPVIILDAGHGGEDPGAIGANGVLEKDLNLAVAFELKSGLEEKGYTVIMTRTEDKMLYTESENIKGIRKLSDLKNRCKFGAEYENALFISIHMNSFGASKYSGLQVYYAHDDSESRSLAEHVQTSVRTNLQPDNDRVVKDGKDIYVLRHNDANAILIECGFITNEAECEKLSEKEYQKELSFAIICGIIEYMNK